MCRNGNLIYGYVIFCNLLNVSFHLTLNQEILNKPLLCSHTPFFARRIGWKVLTLYLDFNKLSTQLISIIW